MKNKIWVLILLGVILLNSVCLSGCRQGEGQAKPSLILPNRDEMTKEQYENNIDVAKASSGLLLNQTPLFADESSAGSVLVEVNEDNPYGFTVEYVLVSSGETVLSTGLIKPGYNLETKKLDVALAKGEYECLVKLVAYDPVTYQEIGMATRQSWITIER
ncbi:MAG: hypothetical protein RRZ24_09650 [Clostridia bacterium]